MKISISGIRGIYGNDLNLHEVIKFSRLFACCLIKPIGKCVLARDTRRSGKIIHQVVSASLMEQGIDVYDLGVAPTPVVFREARKYGAGVVVTASHNPLEWNGLKFVIDGRGIYENELDLMLKATTFTPDTFGKSHDIESDSYYEIFDLIAQTETKTNKAVTLGFDLGGGATCNYVEELFRKLGHKFHCVNDVPGISSRGPDPTVDALNELCTLVQENELDFGFAFDIDGDRLVVVNNRGEKLNPDSTLLLCVASALKMGLKKFVTSIDTSVSVEKLIKHHHGSTEYSKVGEANVVKRILELDADAGGEGSSAGFILPRFNMCRDGLLAAATVSSLDRATINECLRLASEYVQIRSKIPVNSSIHLKLLDKLLDLLRSESSQISTIDGVKAIFDEDSWVLVRPSNTEDAIRVSVESKANDAQSLYNKIMERVMLIYEQVK
jgi:phosphomannomutase